MSWHLQSSRQVQVSEGDGPVDTHIDVIQGDTLFFHAWGSIWAGVWWTGNNGPRGWDNIDNNTKFPLKSSHPYCLFGRLDTPFYIGDDLRMEETPNQGHL